MVSNSSAVKFLLFIWRDVILKKKKPISIIALISTLISFLSVMFHPTITFCMIVMQNCLLNIVLTYLSAVSDENAFFEKRHQLAALVKRFFLRITSIKLLTITFVYIALRGVMFTNNSLLSILGISFLTISIVLILSFSTYHCIIDDIEIRDSIAKGFKTFKENWLLFIKLFLIEILFFIPIIQLVMALKVNTLIPLMITLFSICNELCIIFICFDSLRDRRVENE